MNPFFLAVLEQNKKSQEQILYKNKEHRYMNSLRKVYGDNDGVSVSNQNKYMNLRGLLGKDADSVLSKLNTRFSDSEMEALNNNSKALERALMDEKIAPGNYAKALENNNWLLEPYVRPYGVNVQDELRQKKISALSGSFMAPVISGYIPPAPPLLSGTPLLGIVGTVPPPVANLSGSTSTTVPTIPSASLAQPGTPPPPVVIQPGTPPATATTAGTPTTVATSHSAQTLPPPTPPSRKKPKKPSIPSIQVLPATPVVQPATPPPVQPGTPPSQAQNAAALLQAEEAKRKADEKKAEEAKKLALHSDNVEKIANYYKVSKNKVIDGLRPGTFFTLLKELKIPVPTYQKNNVADRAEYIIRHLNQTSSAEEKKKEAEKMERKVIIDNTHTILDAMKPSLGTPIPQPILDMVNGIPNEKLSKFLLDASKGRFLAWEAVGKFFQTYYTPPAGQASTTGTGIKKQSSAKTFNKLRVLLGAIRIGSDAPSTYEKTKKEILRLVKAGHLTMEEARSVASAHGM